jgi:hypothetical protein
MKFPGAAALAAGFAFAWSGLAHAGEVVTVTATTRYVDCRALGVVDTGDYTVVLRHPACAPMATAYYGSAWGYGWGETCLNAYGCSVATYYPYGGAVRGPYGAAATTGNYYWQSGSAAGVSRSSAGFNAWTGNVAAGTTSAIHDTATGTRAVGRRIDAANVYNGNYLSGERGAAYNERTGAAAAGSHATFGNAVTGNQVEAGRGVVYDPRTGQAARVGGIRGENGGVGHVNNNVYVNRNGTVQQVTPARSRQRPRGGSHRR